MRSEKLSNEVAAFLFSDGRHGFNGNDDVIEAVRELEARNERLKGELDRACKDATRYCGYHHKAEQECDALRAENEELKTKQRYLFREESAHIEECKALRAEVERMRSELQSKGKLSWWVEYQSALIERDALRAEVETLRRAVAALGGANAEILNKETASISRERATIWAENRQLNVAYQHAMCERDEARAERDDALDKLRICGECATTLRKSPERERHGATTQEWCTLQGERDTAIRERDEARADAQRAWVKYDQAMSDKLTDNVDLVTERDAALAKLERVRAWATGKRCVYACDKQTQCSECAKLLSILDAVPVQEDAEKTMGKLAQKAFDRFDHEVVDTERDYDVVVREAVLFQDVDGGLAVASPYHLSHDIHAVARATVTFRIPRKAEVKRSLAERLEQWAHNADDGDNTHEPGTWKKFDALIEELRALENKKPDDPRSTKP